MSHRVLACILLSLLSCVTAHAGVQIVVNSTKDLPDADLVDGVCDADLVAPGEQITLRAAIQHANVTPGDDFIDVPAGVYRLKRKTTDIDTGDFGDLDVTENVTIHGAGSPVTIIDAKKCKDRAFEITDCAITFTDVTIRNGKARPTERGGGISVDIGTLTVQRCVVRGCKADDDGGGIDCVESVCSMTDTVITKCKSGDDSGALDMSITDGLIDRSTFSKNKSKTSGGAIEISDATVVVRNCTFSGNKAHEGGAIAIETGSTVDVRSCTLVKNKATQGSGIDEDLADGFTDTITLTNTILANKPTTNFAGDGIASDGGNIDTGVTCGFGPNITDQSSTNPKLKGLKVNGGFTPTCGLKPTSPAIDRGNDATAPPADQRGLPRIDHVGIGTSIADCGAFEVQP